MSDIEEIEKRALKLPVNERARLASHLLRSLDGDIDEGSDEAWIEEIDRRYKNYKDGKVKARPFDDVMKDARARFG